MSKKFIVAAGALVGASLLATQQAQASTYTVKSGDTISSIAKKKYDTSSLDAIETIVQANNIPDRNFILIGDKLELPNKIKKFKGSKVTYQAPAQSQNVGSYTQAPVQSTQQQNVTSQNTASTTTTPSYTGADDLHSYVTSRMASATGVDAGTWATIVQRESNWNPSVTNSSGHYGLFQLDGSYDKHGRSVEGQIQDAIDLYQKQGLNAWSESIYR